MYKPESSQPVLSIIVTVVDGGAALERCLHALAEQVCEDSIEVLIPYDHISRDVEGLSARYPKFTFIDLGVILGGQIPKNELERHHFYDTRRTGALSLARGKLVAILEDRGVPQPDWAREMIRLHEQYPHAAIGGAIRNGINTSRNWAVFICDFGRYQSPLTDKNPTFLSDTNICYKRTALESVKHVWESKYDEARVNVALHKAGLGLMLSDVPVTVQIRDSLTISDMIKERLHWGRNYGQSRSISLKPIARYLMGMATPILPVLLYYRHLRRQLSKGYHIKEFLFASPVLISLLVCWSLGECIGYYEGPPVLQKEYDQPDA